MASSDAAWRTWGKSDPYFGVLTDPKFRKENIEDNKIEFLRTGKEYVEERLGAARRHFDYESKGRALDFGCGVGRLTLPMAELFEEAVGVDISEEMLKEASQNAALFGIHNVAFVQSDDQVSRAQGEFDFVNSYIVLQHIPVKRGMVIIDRLLRSVRQGGVAALHFGTYRQETWLQRVKYIVQFRVPGGAAAVSMISGSRNQGPAMEMNEYPLAVILARAANLGFGPVLIETEMHGRVVTVKMLTMRA